LFESDSNLNSTEIPNQSTVSNGISHPGQGIENGNEKNSNSENIRIEENPYDYPIEGQNKIYSHQNTFNSNENSQFISNNPHSTHYENNSTFNLSNNSLITKNQSNIFNQNEIGFNSTWEQPEIVGKPVNDEEQNL